MNGPASYAWVGLVGLVAGLLADRLIVRLSLARSLFWPLRDRCPHCHAPLPWVASIPLIGYFLAGGRCSLCQQPLRARAMWIHLLTASLILLLYHLYFRNVGPGLPGFMFPRHPFSFSEDRLWAIWVYHSILFVLLIAATYIDFDWMIIPDSVTVTGMILGIALGTFWYVELHPVLLFHPHPRFTSGLISAATLNELWGTETLPAWIESLRVGFNDHWRHHWNAWLGFLTGAVGLIVGGGTVWVVRAVCSWIFRVEAIGFGDVTLMAMVGAFLGWQTAVIAFFLAPIPAVVVGLFAYLVSGRRAIPYGPHLSIASIGCVLFWPALWERSAEIFEHGGIVLFMAGAMVVVLIVVASMIQSVKMLLGRGRWTSNE